MYLYIYIYIPLGNSFRWSIPLSRLSLYFVYKVFTNISQLLLYLYPILVVVQRCKTKSRRTWDKPFHFINHHSNDELLNMPEQEWKIFEWNKIFSLQSSSYTHSPTRNQRSYDKMTKYTKNCIWRKNVRYIIVNLCSQLFRVRVMLIVHIWSLKLDTSVSAVDHTSSAFCLKSVKMKLENVQRKNDNFK